MKSGRKGKVKEIRKVEEEEEETEGENVVEVFSKRKTAEDKELKINRDRIRKLLDQHRPYAINTERCVVIVGRTGVGKTTFFEVLRDVTHVAKAEGFAYSQTNEVDFRNYGIQERKMSIRVCDTPGLCEIGEKGKVRDNYKIVNKIRECLQKHFTEVHAIFLAFEYKKIQIEDILALKSFSKVFKKQMKNMYILITHAEGADGKKRENSLKLLEKDGRISEIMKYFKDKVYFSGAFREEWMDEGSFLAVKKNFPNIVNDRKKILDLLEQTKKEDAVSLKELGEYIESDDNLMMSEFVAHRRVLEQEVKPDVEGGCIIL